MTNAKRLIALQQKLFDLQEDQQSEINSLIEPLLGAWGGDFNELYTIVDPDMKSRPLADPFMSYTKRLITSPASYYQYLAPSGGNASRSKSQFIQNQIASMLPGIAKTNPKVITIDPDILKAGIDKDKLKTIDPAIFGQITGVIKNFRSGAAIDDLMRLKGDFLPKIKPIGFTSRSRAVHWAGAGRSPPF